MKNARPILMLVFLAVLAFTLATAVEPRFRDLTVARTDEGAFTKLLGDGRRMFSGQAVEMADVYLHSGLYPSIFDNRDATAPKAVHSRDEESEHHDHAGEHEEHAGHDDHDEEHEKAMSFLGPPRDWMEAFIRHFRITQHTHLEGGNEREILPWLKLAIELNPQALNTYIDTSYWLRKKLGRVEDARNILREGIRNNPTSFELLFEMGSLYEQDDKAPAKARDIWLGSLRLWSQQTMEARTNSLKDFSKIAANLAHLETEAGDFPQAIHYYELAKPASPNPAAIQQRIDEVKVQMQNSTNATPVTAPR